MNLSDQVCSLDLAKRLKELSVKQESLFYWILSYKNKFYLFYPEDDRIIHNKEIGDFTYLKMKQEKDEAFSAFSVSELMDLLPACVDKKDREPFNFHWLELKKRSAKNIQWIANYICDSTSFVTGFFFNQLYEHNIYDEKLTDCLAKLIIKLIENGLMKVSE